MQGIEVPAFGDERAQIVSVMRGTSSNSEVLYGYVFNYTEILRGGDWFDVEAKKPITGQDLEDIEIPENLRPNLKSARFAFDLNRHLFYFERRNERGEAFAPSKIKKILENLTAVQHIAERFPDVSITIQPRHDAIGQVLAVPNLAKLLIRLERPNPDDIEGPKARLMSKLEGMNASKQETVLTKTKGAAKLKPDEPTVELAKVAATSGFVQAIGKTINGIRVSRKTSDYPDERILTLDDGMEPFAAIFNLIRHDPYD
jgi:hypothetical protein